MNNSSNSLSNEVSKSRDKIAEYFSKIDSKNFKQFYHDWHGQNMYKPFAQLIQYFHDYSNKEEFTKFCDEFKSYVDGFNNDKPQNEKFSVKPFSKTHDGQLKNIYQGLDNFSFEIRQFVYSFATLEEHHQIFGDYPVKVNMPFAYHKGLDITKEILNSLVDNYDNLTSDENPLKSSFKHVDMFMRENIFTSYKFTQGYDFETKENLISYMKAQKNKLSLVYESCIKNGEMNQEVVELFQAPHFNNVLLQEDNYRANGFELEFYCDEELGNKDDIIKYLKEKNNWGTLYPTNKNPEVYKDENSVGVLMIDESLIPHAGLVPVEYASKIMKTKDDEENCMKLLDSFETGYVNKLCSLHQHVSNQGFDLDTYKRLVKRMMKYEHKMVSSFAAEERGDNNLLYATYISRNLSQNAKRDYPFLCIMVDMCENKEELVDMVSYGVKYKTLNLVPNNTVEFRYMNAHFNREYAQGFLEFNRKMIDSAVNNSGIHIDKSLLAKFSWENNVNDDTKTVIKNIKHAYKHSYDVYNPIKNNVSEQTKEADQSQGRLISHALTQTGKIMVRNPLKRGMVNAR